jgi:hypothetical protein
MVLYPEEETKDIVTAKFIAGQQSRGGQGYGCQV